MRKSFIITLMVVVMIIPVLVLAGPFDLFKKGDSKGAQKIDVNALSARGTSLILKIRAATIAFAEAVVEIQFAVGSATSAEKLKAAIANAKANKDETTTKAIVGEVNNAVSELDKIDLQSKMDLTKARVSLGKSILYLGAGVIADTSAVVDAKALMKESSDALKAVKANPVQYGGTAVTNVQTVISTSTFVAENIPPQASSISTYTEKLIAYAKTNNIEVPSKADSEKMAKEMEKE